MAATQLKIQGADKPQQGQVLSPREEAVRRLKIKGFLDQDGQPMPRRKFLVNLALGWLTFAAAFGAGMAAMFRFTVPSVDFTKTEIFKVGQPSDFPPDTVDVSFMPAHRVWIVNHDHRVFAIWANCRHLGCTPNWMPDARIFKCPCHGSGYTIDGVNFEGPAPFPMWRCEVTVGDDGQIVVNKGRIYAWEKGEWDDPRSFIAA